MVSMGWGTASNETTSALFAVPMSLWWAQMGK